MRNRKIRILHEGNEYYLVDGGRGAASRSITILKPLEQDDDQDPAAVLVKTDIGDCLAIASWAEGTVDVARGHESMREVFQRVVDRYLEEFRVGRDSQNGKTYYFLSADRKPLFSLTRAQPTGLSVLVFTSREAAARVAERRSATIPQRIRIEETHDLADYLAARATEGFAGATLDDVDPIFFCLDGSGAPRFLRLSVSESTGDLEHLLLETTGAWDRYDGEEDLTPEVDQEVVDQHMVDRLGDIPFLGCDQQARFYRPARKVSPTLPAVVDVGDEAIADGRPFCALFVGREACAAFLQENRLDGYAPVEVEDLRQVAGWCLKEGHLLLLQPDGHRARSGILWLDNDRIVLDSFSGLWYSTDGVSFTRD